MMKVEVMNQQTSIDKAARLREMRGSGLVAQGAVKQGVNGFIVSTLSLRNNGRKTEYRIGKDDSGKFICTCAEFGVEAQWDSAFA